MSNFLTCTFEEFGKLKRLADGARLQLQSSELLFRRPGPESNSIAIIMKHVGGNLKSRWTDFLTSDGEKEWRDRDSEFIIGPDDDEPSVTARWEEGWRILFSSLAGSTADDLDRTVTVRGEPHSVLQAACRSLAHTAYHTGQIVYLSRLFVDREWKWLTIAPGASAEFNAKTWGPRR